MTQLSKAAQHRLIAIRYRSAEREAKEGRRGRRPKVCNLRLSEVERIYQGRFGKMLPDNPDGRAALRIVAECIALKAGAVPNITGFIRARAPWALPEAESVAAAAIEAAHWLSADEMAWRIGLSLVEHDTLGIRTIGIVGLNKRQRKARQKDKKKKRETERRRARGAQPRAEYETNSVSRAKPWEALGISRRTWYRRQAAESGTSPCPVSSFYLIRHALVPKSARCLRGALRAGPTGPGPYGPRWTEQEESPARYFDGRKVTAGEARP